MQAYLRILFVLFGALFIQAQSIAQIIPPADWSYEIPNKNVKTGEETEIVFKAVIPETYHVYSNNYVCKFGPLPSEFKFEKHPSFEVVGLAKAVGDHKYFDDVFNCDLADFSKTAEFHQKIKILGKDPVIKGVLEYQMCTEAGLCVLQEYDFNIKGFNVSGDAVVVPVTTDTPQQTATQTVPDEGPDDTIADESPAMGGGLCCDSLLTLVGELRGVVKGSNYDPIPVDSVNYTSYRGSGPEDQTPCEEKIFPGQEEPEGGQYWAFFLVSFISGLLALLTPCVFPMIPMTVSFFMKEGQPKRVGRRNGIIYSLSIIVIYTVIGAILTLTVGPEAANFLSTHWIPNVLFFLVFWIFAASFFGAFEIVLPSWLVNRVDKKSDQGGLAGIFFMAFTIVLVSFSCTGPIVGSIIVAAFGGEVIMPLVGMLGFSLAFALPFGLFAIFPNWLTGLPQSGGWLNSVKVVLGFVELAFGLKFLSVADQTYHWGILDREIYIALWIVIFTLMGIYLLGKIKFSHDSDMPFLKVPRLLFAIITFTFVVYLTPGMFGAPLQMLAGYLPPMSTHDFSISEMIDEVNDKEMDLCEKPRYSERLHLPHGLKGYFDYEQGMECARKLGKPVFIDFTGHGCVNCREMEARVWSDPRVLEILREEYVIISLYVDDKTLDLPEDEWYWSKVTNKQVTTLAKKNADIQMCYFKANAQPLYALLDNKGDMLAPRDSYNLDKQAYVDFLKDGLAEYKKRMRHRLLK